MTASESRSVVYTIDSNYSITSVGPEWDEFAIENEAENAVAERVRGRAIWEFISDETTRELYRMALERVSEWGQPISFPFRCDSPGMRRYLQMEISPLDGGGWRLASTTYRETPREPVELLRARRESSDEPPLRMCSWCKRVNVPETDIWVEVEEAIRVLELFERELLPPITHGMCPSCYARIAATIKGATH